MAAVELAGVGMNLFQDDRQLYFEHSKWKKLEIATEKNLMENLIYLPEVYVIIAQ